MRNLSVLVVSLMVAGPVLAKSEPFKFNFKNTDVSKVIEAYSENTGENFAFDQQTRGKITLLFPKKLSRDEAFHAMSVALAHNGLAISVQEDVNRVIPARIHQRSYMEVSSQLPSLKPERMVTYIRRFKYLNADNVNKQLRLLTSKDGEAFMSKDAKAVVIVDWVSNMHKIEKVLAELDQKMNKRKYKTK